MGNSPHPDTQKGLRPQGPLCPEVPETLTATLATAAWAVTRLGFPLVDACVRRPGLWPGRCSWKEAIWPGLRVIHLIALAWQPLCFLRLGPDSGRISGVRKGRVCAKAWAQERPRCVQGIGTCPVGLHRKGHETLKVDQSSEAPPPGTASVQGTSESSQHEQIADGVQKNLFI